MRPVNKKQVGDKITLYDDIPDMATEVHVVKEDYKPYGNAQNVLLANLGCYCSYCECYLSNGTQIEHIKPKSKYPELETKWDNFLLSCPKCNGASNKSSSDVVLDEIHLPHRNNTYLSLCYKEAGVVIANPSLTGKSKTNAENLIKLIGLDKPDSGTDLRCNERRKMWNEAQLFLKKYDNKDCELDLLINHIKYVGYWSIWFTVFKNYDEVRKALIESFSGTSVECFDEENHYEPKFRNESKIDDKV